MTAHPTTFSYLGIHVSDAYVTAWGNARATYYGVDGIPDVWFDGILRRVGGSQGMNYNAEYNARSAVPTDVTIDVSPVYLGGQSFEMTAHVCIEAGGVGKTMRIYMVQVLDHWPAVPDYQRNGFKQAAATQDITLAPGGCTDVVRTFTFDNETWTNLGWAKILVWAQPLAASGPAEFYNGGMYPIAGAADSLPPFPNPASYSVVPTSSSPNAVVMTATGSADWGTPPVRYFFDESTGGPGANDSTWQTSAIYADVGLQPDTLYAYQVTTRDSAVPPNATTPSAVLQVTTRASVPGTVAISNVTGYSMDLDPNRGTNPAWTLMAIQCSSTTDAAWNGKYVDAAGSPSATPVWQNDADWGATPAMGLLGETEYCFKAKAMNGAGVETTLGAQSCATTEAAAPSTLVSVASCAFHCPTPGCEVDLLCLDLPQSGGTKPVEPRQFAAGTDELLLELELSGPPSGAVTVEASCTDGSHHGAAVQPGLGLNDVEAVFDPPLPNRECCTLTLSGGATGTGDVRMLFGDADRNGVVNSGDVNLVRAEIGTSAASSPVFWYDVDRNGAINAGDKNLVRAEIGGTLDPGCP